VRMFGNEANTKTTTATKGKSGQGTAKQSKSAKSAATGKAGQPAKTGAAKPASGGKAAATGGKAAAKGGKAAAKGGAGGSAKRPARTGKSRKGGSAGARQADALTRKQLPLAARIVILVVAFAAMVGFAVVLSKLTLGPSAASESLTHSNLRPGDSIRDYLSQPQMRDTLKQLGGNVVLGMPFGALLPALVPRTRGLLRVMTATAVVMLLVELVQGALVTGRAFDIDDVILNTTGAMLGYLIIGRRLGLAVHPRRRHWWHRFRVSSSRRRR
jgi:glycopeptide antibiotics resistance protein